MDSASRGSKKEEPTSSSSSFPDNHAKPVQGQPQGSLAASPLAGQEQEWVSGFMLLRIMTAITFPCFLLMLYTSIVVTGIPVITSDFHSLPDAGWYGSAYLISSAVLQPLTGKLYVNFHTKWIFLTLFAIFELGSLLCGVAKSSRMLIIGRAVAGMGASGILNGTLTIIAGCVPMPKRPALIGFVTGISQLGLVLGPLIGGAFTDYVTWRWCFYVNLPIGGLVVLLIVFVHVPDQLPKPPATKALHTLPSNLDLIGFAIFAPAAIQLLLALQYGGNTFAWISVQIIGLFCQVYCVSYYLPIYFQGVKGVSPMLNGVYILPVVITHVIFAFVSGAVVGKVGYYLPFMAIGSISVAIAFYYVMIGVDGLALFLMVPAFWRATANEHGAAIRETGDGDKRTIYTVLKSPMVWLVVFFLLGYVGVKVSLRGWIAMVKLNVWYAEPFLAGLTSTFFWLGLTVGRVVLGFTTASFVTFLGFYFGPLFPAAIVTATKLLPRDYHASTIGFVTAFGGGGAALFSCVIYRQ
ncbi:hypothetical protein VTI28DRAFT_7939 [Corynascus sepedonium]